MSTDEVFDYFTNCKPFSIEWINDNVCNVVWKDDSSSSYALIQLTKPYIKKNIDISDTDVKSDETETDIVDNDDNINLPLGKWRIGQPSKKGNQLFLRFAKQSDKKVKGAESRSEYYRKYGNPNYGNIRGLISNSKRVKLKSDLFHKYVNYDVDDSAQGLLHTAGIKTKNIF
jgi:hypothetical protein